MNKIRLRINGCECILNRSSVDEELTWEHEFSEIALKRVIIEIVDEDSPGKRDFSHRFPCGERDFAVSPIWHSLVSLHTYSYSYLTEDRIDPDVFWDMLRQAHMYTDWLRLQIFGSLKLNAPCERSGDE